MAVSFCFNCDGPDFDCQCYYDEVESMTDSEWEAAERRADDRADRHDLGLLERMMEV